MTPEGMKPRVKYDYFRQWNAAFDTLTEGDLVRLNGEVFVIGWKHEDPNWLQLKTKKRGRKMMIRFGEPVIFDLRPYRERQ